MKRINHGGEDVNDFTGVPLLETHHVRRLVDKGPDTTDNVAALCPNCHRELHYGARAKDLIQACCCERSEPFRG